MAVVTGQSFGNFQVVRLLGEGGFGEVYEAENPFLQRRAAVKVLHPGMVQDPELVRRFLNEARAASAIRHPNIIDVFDAGVTQDGEPYILMEFLEGDSLQKVMLQQGRLALATVQEIAKQAGAALSAAHLAGIVHRDLKPENVFLVPDANAPLGFCVKVLDFGIAKIKHIGDGGSTIKTQAGLLMGSPAYMSPEQCRDSSDVDHRTDIYSLGIIIYEMLAGVPPFSSKSATEMLVLHLTAEPRPLREYLPDLPANVEQAVARALCKERELRYSSVDYFVGALLGNYPAATAQGNPAMGQPGEGFPGRGLTPAPVVTPGRVGLTPAPVGFSSRYGLTPAPLPSNPTVTTFSRATGETGARPELSDADFAPARKKRWPFMVAGLLAAGAAAGLVVHLRSTPSPAPSEHAAAPAPEPPKAPATVRVQVRSEPAGAAVVDSVGGAILGVTPLERSYPRSDQTMGLLLRLAGHKDKSVSVSLGDNSSTSVDLEPTEPARPASSKPAKESQKSTGTRRPSKPVIDEEAWRVH